MVVTVLDQPTPNVPLPQPRPPDPTPQQPAAPSATKPQELAVLTVNGVKFDDWESVYGAEALGRSVYLLPVHRRRARPGGCSKERVSALAEAAVQAGRHLHRRARRHQAVTGFIEMRQVAYNATSHGVMLIGKSVTAWAARSSVDTKTGSFDGKNILQVAQEVLAPYPVGIKVIGQIDLTPFVHLQNEKGELIWDFLERLARPRGIVMGSDSEGNFLLIGDHTFATVTGLIEGQNIKSCQCTIRHDQTYSKYRVDAQATGHR